MKVRKIINGILALVLSATILLISDSSNRIKKDQGITHPDKTLKKGLNKSDHKAYKFSFTHYVDSHNSEECEKGLREEFERLGYIEGKDYSLKVFNAQGDVSTLNSIGETIAADKWDIVFASSTPTLQVFFKKIKNSPIVFTNVGDPVRSGIGESFTNHPANVTGVSTISDFTGLVNFIIEIMPGIKKIGTVYTPGEINSVIYNDELRLAAEKKGLILISVPANSVSEVSDAARSMSSRGVEAFAQISDNLTGSCSSTIIKESYNSGIPYFAFVTDQTKQGAVASVARDYYEAGADAARKAVKILKGTSPADIPFDFVKKTKITINKKGMDAFKIEIPRKYLTPEFLINSEEVLSK